MVIRSVLPIGSKSPQYQGQEDCYGGNPVTVFSHLPKSAIFHRPFGPIPVRCRKDFTFINVHIPYEGKIAKTDAFVPYNEIDKNLDKLPAGKNAKIVLYGRCGRMSSMAAETLVRLRYTNVWNLDGGMSGWEQQGFELIRK